MSNLRIVLGGRSYVGSGFGEITAFVIEVVGIVKHGFWDEESRTSN